MAGCGCGSKKKDAQKYVVVSPDGTVQSTSYSSEVDARMAAAREPGSRVRPA